VGRAAALLLFGLAGIAVDAASLKYEHGRLLRLDPRDESVWVGETRIDVAGQAKQFRQITVRDFSINAKGTLAVSASAAYNAGVLDNVILLFDTTAPAPPKIIPTGDVFCELLSWGPSGLWCMGPDFRKLVANEIFAALWVVALDGDMAPLLRRDKFPEGDGPPWKSGLLGDPQLFESGGGMWIWVPNAGTVIRYGSRFTAPTFFGSGVAPVAKSRISMAGWGGTVLGLFPLRTQGEETFTTPYALFSLDAQGRRWLRASDALLPRGAQLLAVENNQAVIWDRRGKGSLVRVPLRPPVR
jgi:hypothetical protein